MLGPSGCGKTTTLRAITGFVKPSEGKIYVEGKDITDIPVEKRNIGMVFQSFNLFNNKNYQSQILELGTGMMLSRRNNG